MKHAPHRTRLPATRRSITRKATICGFEVYMIVGFFDDGSGVEQANRPGELFVKLAKHGTEISGIMDMAAMLISVSLQYGVPWPVLRDKLTGTKFGTPDHQYTSLLDGIAKNLDEIIEDRAEMLGLDEPDGTTDS